MLHNKRDLGFHESEYKVLMHLNEYYRLCVEVEECGGYLIEGDVFLLFHNAQQPGRDELTQRSAAKSYER